ncbi:MAG: spore germination protein [Erysipelotrichaceae bacterium]
MDSFQKKIEHMKQVIAPSFDVVYRSITIREIRAYVIYLSSLSDGSLISDVIESIVITSAKTLELTFYPGSVDATNLEDKAILQILSGQCIVIVDQDAQYYCIETRHYPSRSTSEPQVEKSVRGAHDGFVENIILNVGLIRRRIRDPKLHIILNKEGVKTRTDIAYLYIDSLVDQEILNDFESRLLHLAQIEILSERNLCELLYGKTLNPYPHVRYSERPDICSIHILQGYLIVLVDNAPSAMIIPTTFFEQTKQIEEYTQTSVIATFTRIIRFSGILFSLYLLPLWITLVVTHNETMLHIPIQAKTNLFEFGFQIIFIDIIVEWIRQSLIHTPSILSSIMSFVAIFVLGDMAIKLGAYTEAILIIVALCNIGNLLTPSYELALANKFFRILMSLLALFLGLPGLCIGIIFHVVVLMSTKSIKFPYLYPFIPLSFKEVYKLLFGNVIKFENSHKN